MPMITSGDARVLVDHHQFLLLDGDGLGDEPEGVRTLDDLPIPEDAWFSAAYNVALVISSFQFYEAEVRFEVWDAEPERPPGWDRVELASLFSPSGEFFFIGIFGGGGDVAVELGVLDSHWRVLAAAKASQYDYTEKFLFQFWPEER